MWIGEEVGVGRFSGINSLDVEEKNQKKKPKEKKSQKEKPKRKAKRKEKKKGVVKAEKTPTVGQRRAVGSRQCILNHTGG
jgi:hypothetical protein